MKRALQVVAFSFAVACLSASGAGAQQLPPGTHVMVKPTGNDAVGGTIVRFDRGAYIIHFDQPYYGSPELRVSPANTQPGGGAGGAMQGQGGALGGPGAPAQKIIQAGMHVMAKPTGNEAVGGTVVKAVNGGYVIHFDQPWNGFSDLRVSTANVQAGGAAGGGNPNNNANAGQKQAAPQAQPQLNPANQNAVQAPAGSLAAQFQEIIRQKYVGAAQPDDQVTVTFQSWSMTGPAPYQDAYAGAVNQHTILGGPGPTVNAYQIQTKFTVDHHYTSSGAHNMNYITGPYVGFKDNSGQLQTRAAGGGSNTSKYIPGP